MWYILFRHTAGHSFNEFGLNHAGDICILFTAIAIRYMSLYNQWHMHFIHCYYNKIYVYFQWNVHYSGVCVLLLCHHIVDIINTWSNSTFVAEFTERLVRCDCLFDTGIGVWDRTEGRKYSIEFISEDYKGENGRW